MDKIEYCIELYDVNGEDPEIAFMASISEVLVDRFFESLDKLGFDVVEAGKFKGKEILAVTKRN